ncbi:MAG TPA: glycosyltransferase family A protein [Casimicrobiaceae bacterium]|nr:glycosyltransferase family A protein [Casimicrobiaceae bacterium]
MEGPAGIKVSVIVPCFNSAAYVERAVESVLLQSLRDVEIVLVDDGSEDDTRDVLARIAARHTGRAVRIIARSRGGTAAARNTGIANAQGRYVLPLDADDAIAPTMLEACARELDTAESIDIVYTDREDFGEVCGVAQAGQFCVERLAYFNQIGYCSLFRRSLWEAIGGYRVNVSGFDDWDFWLAAALLGARARHIAAPLFRHHRRADSQLGRLLPHFERLHARIVLNNTAAYSAADVRAARRFLDDGGDPPASLSFARFLFMARYFESARMPVGATRCA